MRRNRLITALTAAAAVLSSCSGSFGVIVPNFENYDGLSVNNTEVRAVHNFTSGSLPIFTELAQEFSSTNRYGINVVLNEADADFIDRLNAKELSDEERPNLVFGTPSQAAAMLRAGTGIELSPLFSHPEWGYSFRRREFYPAAKKQTDYFDFAMRITSVPVLMNSYVTALNNDLMTADGISDLPDTWVGMQYQLRRAGRNEQTFLGIDDSTEAVFSVISARGGSILRPIGFTYSISNPVVNRTLRYLRNLEERGTLTVDRTHYSVQTQFAFGRLHAAVISTDGISRYSDLIAMTSPEMNWSVDLMPSRRPGSTSVVNCTESAAIVEGRPEDELASWLFVKWLNEPEQQKRLAAATFSFPVIRGAAADLIEKRPSNYPPQWLDALEIVDDSSMLLMPSLFDFDKVASDFEDMMQRINSGNWIWLETIKLQRAIKLERRTASERKAGKR